MAVIKALDNKVEDSVQAENRRAIERFQRLSAELRNAPVMGVSMISVELSKSRRLA
jgi:hypothetical protein